MGMTDMQKLYIGKSTDNGVTWQIDREPAVEYVDTSIIDPTAVKLGEKRYRIYYSTAGGSYKSGILELR